MTKNSPRHILLACAVLLGLMMAQPPAHGAGAAPAQAATQAGKDGRSGKNKHHNRKQSHRAKSKAKQPQPLKTAKPHNPPAHRRAKAKAAAKGKPVQVKTKPAANPAEPHHKAAQAQKPPAHRRAKAKAAAKGRPVQPKPKPAAKPAEPHHKAAQAQKPPVHRRAKAKAAAKGRPVQAKPKPAEPHHKASQAQMPPTYGRAKTQWRRAQPKKPVAAKAAAQPKSAAEAKSRPKAERKPAEHKRPVARRQQAAPPPSKPRDASAFIRRRGEMPRHGMSEIRRSRHTTREGNRVVIREGDRTIERDNHRTIIRHRESDRFAVGARRVDVEHHGDRTVRIVMRPDGVRIISTTDRHGHLIRRVRRDPHGRDFVIFDDSAFAPRRRDDMFVRVRPPHIRDRQRYIVDASRADRRRIYEVFTAPPIVPLYRYYTVDQVRYSHPLREYMPRVDLDIHFDTGSWQLTPDQIDRLGAIAAALNEAIDRNPRELFLIEGHTDAIGSAEDNLSLSDRRAEAVAVALTEVFRVPPENLVTQGYGEEYLKVPTLGPSRANRRVAVRRITPLIARR